MENKNLNKPLVEQIYDELFSNIKKHVEFSEETITELKQLASKGELKKHGKVIEAIKVTVAKKKDETSGTGN